MKRPIEKLRQIALAEGISYLLLLGVAMPLKYALDMPMAVRVLGSVHGALFVLFCFALAYATWVAKWPLGRPALVFLASLIPFGPWLIDRRMVQYDREFESRRSPSLTTTPVAESS